MHQKFSTLSDEELVDHAASCCSHDPLVMELVRRIEKLHCDLEVKNTQVKGLLHEAIYPRDGLCGN